MVAVADVWTVSAASYKRLIQWHLISDFNTFLHLLFYMYVFGAIHTSELDRSEIDLGPKRSECERSSAN